jgi:hypothetical protein
MKAKVGGSFTILSAFSVWANWLCWSQREPSTYGRVRPPKQDLSRLIRVSRRRLAIAQALL